MGLEVVDFVLELLDCLVLCLDERTATISIHPGFLDEFVEVAADAGSLVFGLFPPFFCVVGQGRVRLWSCFRGVFGSSGRRQNWPEMCLSYQNS